MVTQNKSIDPVLQSALKEVTKKSGLDNLPSDLLFTNLSIPELPNMSLAVTHTHTHMHKFSLSLSFFSNKIMTFDDCDRTAGSIAKLPAKYSPT